MRTFFRASTFVLCAFLSISAFAQSPIAGATGEAAPTSPSAFTNIKIGNFGQMDAGYYRGAQPLPEDYKSLADLGVKTIVDLRNDPTDYEKSAAEAVGIKYVAIPMSGWRSPKDEDIAKFLEVANDPATGVMYVHCKAGIHRTGITAAVYRMRKYGWDYDTAYTEMKNYNFYSGLFHGALKKYVKNYAERINTEKTATTTISAAPVAVSEATAKAN